MASLVKDDVIPTGAMEPGGGVASPIAGATVVKRPDPRLEYVVAGKARETSDPLALPESIDDLTRTYGFTPYDALMAVPGVASSINTLKLGIMAGDLQLTETHPVAYFRKSMTPEQKLSGDVKDFCERALNRIPGFRSSLIQMLDAVLYGNKLGEMTADVATEGPDIDKLVYKTFTVKHRKSWLFVVDQSLNVKGILARGGQDRQGYQILPPEKFMWLTWMPHNNDPRGTSAARPAYAPANLSVQLYAEYRKYLKQFAGPSIIAKTDPNSEPYVDETTGATITPTMVLSAQLELFENGMALVIPAGAEAMPILAQGNGEAFINGFTFLDQQMVLSILLQTRATREAQNGSKADSEQGADVMDLITGYGRDNFGDTIRNQMLKPLVTINYGQEVADTFTPWVYFGSVNPQNTAQMWNALASVYKAGGVTKSTQQEFHARADAPIPDQEVDQAAQEEEDKRQAELNKPEPPQDGSGKPQDDPGGASDGGADEFSHQRRKYSLWLRRNGSLVGRGMFSGR